jgi:hypothetical protein
VSRIQFDLSSRVYPPLGGPLLSTPWLWAY